MGKKLAATVMMPLLVTALIVPETAMARRNHVHRGHSAACSGGKGVVGTVAGAAGGAVIGGAVIGGPVATIAGGVGGAILGRHIDKQNVRRRHGCRR